MKMRRCSRCGKNKASSKFLTKGPGNNYAGSPPQDEEALTDRPA